MTDFIRKNKIWLGTVPFLLLFFLYVFLANYYFIPRMEDTLHDWFEGVIRPAVIVSILAIVIFQIVFLHLILSIKLKDLIQINQLQITLVFLVFLICILLLFQCFPESHFEDLAPNTIVGLGHIIELIFGAYIEEIVFRGFLFMVLYKWTVEKFKFLPKRLMAFGFMLFSSLLFGLFHIFYYSLFQKSFYWITLIPPFLIGMIFCVIYVNTKNLLITMVLHWIINYRFFTFPMTNTSQGLSAGLIVIIILILMVIGHVIYKKGEVRYIDE